MGVGREPLCIEHGIAPIDKVCILVVDIVDKEPRAHAVVSQGAAAVTELVGIALQDVAGLHARVVACGDGLCQPQMGECALPCSYKPLGERFNRHVGQPIYP